MKISIKIISFILLLVFFGLLGIGILVDSHANTQSGSQGADCFGNSCGPVQHVVAHDYVIVSWSQVLINQSHEQQLAGTLIVSKSTYKVPDTPPPQFSLS